MKRIAVMFGVGLGFAIVLSTIFSLLGIGHYVQDGQLAWGPLVLWCFAFGMIGSFIQLALSKKITKWTTKLDMITEEQRQHPQYWVYQEVKELASRQGITTPEVGIYEGAPNAFATGATKNAALVGVSTGLLATMDRSEVRAVLAHEIGHIVNGDMVTMTLVQGMVNAFVMIIARAVGFAVDKALSSSDEEGSAGTGFAYYAIVFGLEIVLGLLALPIVAWFSRQREYRADAFAKSQVGAVAMQNALRRLSRIEEDSLPKGLANAGIKGSKQSSLLGLLSSHPPIEQRIAALNG